MTVKNIMAKYNIIFIFTSLNYKGKSLSQTVGDDTPIYLFFYYTNL